MRQNFMLHIIINVKFLEGKVVPRFSKEGTRKYIPGMS